MTAKSKEIKKLVDGYLTKVKTTEAKLAELENASEGVQIILGSRKDTQSEREAVEEQIAVLEDERGSLFHAFYQAQFESDQTEVERVEERRSEIDTELSQKRQTIRKLQTDLENNPVPAEKIAVLIAELETIQLPGGQTLQGELKKPLLFDYELNDRHKRIRNAVPASEMNEETYDAEMTKRDSSYQASKRKHEAAIEKTRLEEERRKNYVSPFDTPSGVSKKTATVVVQDYT